MEGIKTLEESLATYKSLVPCITCQYLLGGVTLEIANYSNDRIKKAIGQARPQLLELLQRELKVLLTLQSDLTPAVFLATSLLLEQDILSEAFAANLASADTPYRHSCDETDILEEALIPFLITYNMYRRIFEYSYAESSG